jgi:hypothetical protein
VTIWQELCIYKAVLGVISPAIGFPYLMSFPLDNKFEEFLCPHKPSIFCQLRRKKFKKKKLANLWGSSGLKAIFRISLGSSLTAPASDVLCRKKTPFLAQLPFSFYQRHTTLMFFFSAQFAKVNAATKKVHWPD